jgi:hypothetical protein
MGAMALHGYSSMELKSRSFTSKEPHVAGEPQVADPCPILMNVKVPFSVYNSHILKQSIYVCIYNHT